LPLNRSEKGFWIGLSVLLVVIMGGFLAAPAWTYHPPLRPHADMGDMSGMSMEEMANMPGMEHGATAEETPAQQAKHLADKRESEFNHHLAGVLVILAALFFLGQPALTKRWPSARYAWPMCFLIAGVFLLVFSDTEIWPFGNQSFIYAMLHNPEDVQHKTFALILLVMGVVEMLRASERLKAAWSAWVFPVVALGGCVLLLFHHHGGMHGPDAMKTMVSVQHQHAHFAEAGAGAAVAKGLAESNSKWYEIFSKVWPLFMIVLGVMLVMYTE
jgi:putative copper resistance protein D